MPLVLGLIYESKCWVMLQMRTEVLKLLKGGSSANLRRCCIPNNSRYLYFAFLHVIIKYHMLPTDIGPYQERVLEGSPSTLSSAG